MDFLLSSYQGPRYPLPPTHYYYGFDWIGKFITNNNGNESHGSGSSSHSGSGSDSPDLREETLVVSFLVSLFDYRRNDWPKVGRDFLRIVADASGAVLFP
jgi:hypothetical protein